MSFLTLLNSENQFFIKISPSFSEEKKHTISIMKLFLFILLATIFLIGKSHSLSRVFEIEDENKPAQLIDNPQLQTYSFWACLFDDQDNNDDTGFDTVFVTLLSKEFIIEESIVFYRSNAVNVILSFIHPLLNDLPPPNTISCC